LAYFDFDFDFFLNDKNLLLHQKEKEPKEEEVWMALWVIPLPI
jgi:hypothetical protein